MHRSIPALLSLLVSAFLAYPAICRGQTPDFGDKSRWVHFTASSGLPSGEITNIYDSSDSTLWVSTFTGIAWFDGFRWRRIDSASGLPANAVVLIRGEYRGKILVYYSGEYYLGNRNGFRKLLARAGDSLVFTENGGWRATDRTALSMLYSDPRCAPDPKFLERVNGVFPTKSGSVWLTLTDGLYRRDSARWTLRLPASEGPPSLSVSMVTENSRGSGICLVRTPMQSMGMWEWSRNGQPVRSELEKNIFFMICADIDENDNVVAAAQTGEVFLRHDGAWKMLPVFPENARDIAKVLFRRNGDLCVGSENGIYIWRRSFNRWINIPQSPLEIKNYINEILMTPGGDLWIGSANGAEVRRANGGTQDFTTIGGRPILNVTGLQVDNDGGIWISSGSSFDGAYRWDGKSWKWHPIISSANGINIHKIRRDRQGRLWFLGLGHNISTPDDDAAGAFVLDHGVFTRWGLQEGLLSGRAYAFDETPDGALWFGTHKGISRLRDGRWTHWSSANGLHHDHVFCLAADQQGGIWFGHMSIAGLGYIDARDSLRYFTTDDGLPDNRIYDIRVDSGGVVWITSLSGLCSYDHGRWSIYDERSGLISNALWPVLPLKHSVYVGTIGKGTAILNRDAGIAPPPIVVIQKPIVENRDAHLRWVSFAYYGEVAPENILTRYRLNGGEWSPWSTGHEISFREIDAGSYSIDVQAKGLNGQFSPIPEEALFTILPPLYLRPVIYLPGGAAILALTALLAMYQIRRVKHRRELEKSEERYRLITELMSDYAYLLRIEDNGGLAILWITDSFTRLTGYSPGEFLQPGSMRTLSHPDDLPRITAMFDSVKRGNPESFENRILTKDGELLWFHNHIAPMWNRNRSRVTHVYGIARDITRRKHDEEQMRLLATELSLTEERERRRMATFLHDTISQTLAFSKIKLRLLERAVREPDTNKALAEIRQLIEESLKNTRSLTFELSPPALHETGVAVALRSLAQQLFEQHDINLEFADDELPHQVSNEMGIVLFYAVREVFINIIKHSQASAVAVSVCSVKDSIRVTVQDNGIGISPEADERKDSFGLTNIRERLTYIGGCLEIRSAPNKGTTVVLSVPAAKTDSTHGEIK